MYYLDQQIQREMALYEIHPKIYKIITRIINGNDNSVVGIVTGKSTSTYLIQDLPSLSKEQYKEFKKVFPASKITIQGNASYLLEMFSDQPTDCTPYLLEYDKFYRFLETRCCLTTKLFLECTIYDGYLSCDILCFGDIKLTKDMMTGNEFKTYPNILILEFNKIKIKVQGL